jgi:uncharacterized protein (DUF58 family)
MWLRNIFRPRREASPARQRTALDERLLRRLERLALAASRGLKGGLSGIHPSRRRLPAPTFTDHRPYTSGDDLRYVDWNAYARLEDLHLKLGEAEHDIRVHVLIDCSASMDWGEGDAHKLHYARLLAAAIGYVALANGDRLRVVPFGGAERQPWGPGSGRQRAAHLLQFLDDLQGGGDITSITRLHQMAREERGGLLVVLSDFWHSRALVDGDDPILAPFQLPRWQVLMLHVLHPDELRPDLRGDIELIDSESGERLSIEANAGALAAYSTAAEGWCASVAKMCARRNFGYSRITTDMSLERAALPYLQLREVLR